MAELGQQVVQVHAPAAEPGGELFGLFLLDGLRGPLHKADDIAHAENARGDPLRVEDLDAVELLARADELDRPPGDMAHGERCAAARIAVDPGQHDAGDADLLVEGPGGVDSVLAGHRIGDQQRFDRLYQVAQRRRLFHHLAVDGEPAGSIDEDDVVALARGDAHGAPCDGGRAFAEHDGQGVDPGLPAEQFELLLGGGPIDVHRGHEHLLAVPVRQAAGELGGRCRLAGALQAQHQHGERGIAAEPEVLGLAAQHLDHAVMDDLDDLLARRDGPQHVVPDGLLLDRVEQRPNGRQRSIGFQQRHAHFPERRLDISGGEGAAPGEAPENLAEPLCQSFEHVRRFLPPVQRRTHRCAKTRGPAGLLGGKACNAMAKRGAT